MLAKRLIVAFAIFALLTACGSDPVRDDSGPSPQGTQQSSGNNTSPGANSSGGGGDFNIPGNVDPRVLLGVIVVVVVVVSAVAIYHLASESIDSIRKHTHPADAHATLSGIYRDPQGLFSVVIPGDPSALGPDGIEVRQTASKEQEQVFFITARDDDPVYSISVEPLASPDDATMPLPDFANRAYPPPISSDSTAPQASLPALEQDITLDGKPALFREYSPGSGADGRHPMYYLLYFIRDSRHSAVLSITWFKDCPDCSNGPEAAIRGMDPHLKQFVESFRLNDVPSAMKP